MIESNMGIPFNTNWMKPFQIYYVGESYLSP